MKTRLIVTVVFIVVLIVLYQVSGLDELFTLERLQENKEEIQHYAMEMKLMAVPAFATLYFVAVALSLPFAALLSLLAGFLFGVVWGTAIVVSMATLGATAIFLLARFLLGGYFLERYGERLARINRELSENALYHLLFLRLVPLFPFFLVNIAPAFARVKLRDFILATFIGIIPGSFVYVNAGTQLSRVESTSDIFSPSLLISFALLGVLALVPVAWKKWRGARRS